MFPEVLALIIGIGLIAWSTQSKKVVEEVVEADKYDDYEIIRKAAISYKKRNKKIAKTIEELKEFLPEDMDLNGLSLTLDGQFLIMHYLSQSKIDDLLKRVGGDSYTISDKVFLTLRKKTLEDDTFPEADFEIIPQNHIKTTTLVTYNTNKSYVEDDIIKEKKWDNKLSFFRTPGEHKIKLKIKDRNGRWSEWTEKVIEVEEEEGIKEIIVVEKNVIPIYKNGVAHYLREGDQSDSDHETSVSALEGSMENQSSDATSFATSDSDDVNKMPEDASTTNNDSQQEDDKKVSTEKKEEEKTDFHTEELLRLISGKLPDNVAQISTGDEFMICRLYDGTVSAIGRNDKQQLGYQSDILSKEFRTIIELENICQIASGKDFSAALTSQGEVYVWGNNEHIILPGSKRSKIDTPTRVANLEGVKQVAIGKNHIMALQHDGTVVGWGNNAFGQLGTGYTTEVADYVVSSFSDIDQIAAGDNYTIAIDIQGRVFGTGKNNCGQLGIREKSEYHLPVLNDRLKSIISCTSYMNASVLVDKMGKLFFMGELSNVEGVYYELPEFMDKACYPNSVALDSQYLYVEDNNNKVHIYNGTLMQENIVYLKTT